jgi:hypothetical protein
MRRATAWACRLAPQVVLAGLVLTQTAHAQAWLPTRGTFDTSVVYTSILNKKHYDYTGTQSDVGHTRLQSVALKFSYGLTDRLTLTGGIPFVRAKYYGAFRHPTEIDDGDYHSSFTDWRLGLHFQVSDGPIAFAPFVQYGSPIVNYETLGHAAHGRGLNELALGFFAGKNLDAVLPGTYVQLRYGYSFVEKVAGISHDRSNIDAEVGHFLTPRLSLRAMVSWQETYGGLPLPVPPSNPLYPHHDQLGAEGFVTVGTGAAFSMTPATDLYCTFSKSVKGVSGHKLDQSVSLGWSHRFGR